MEFDWEIRSNNYVLNTPVGVYRVYKSLDFKDDNYCIFFEGRLMAIQWDMNTAITWSSKKECMDYVRHDIERTYNALKRFLNKD